MARMRKAAALAAAAVLALGATACGGDDDDTSASDVEETTTTEAADDADDGDDGDTGGGSVGGDDVDLDDLEEILGGDCMTLASALMVAATPMASLFGGPEAAEGLEESAEHLAEAAKKLPAEVRDDFAVMAAAFEEFTKALAAADVDLQDPAAFSNPAAMAKLQPALEAFESEELQRAQENIDRWLDEHCSG